MAYRPHVDVENRYICCRWGAQPADPASSRREAGWLAQISGVTAIVRHDIFLVVLFSGTLATTGYCEQRPLWVCITRPDLEKSVRPLADHRREDGYEVVVSTAPIEAAIKQLPRQPEILLLVGDSAPGEEGSPWYVPTKRFDFYRWIEWQPPEASTDSMWGDLDGDGMPEVPVGRIPARNADEVKVVVAKILAYEQRPISIDDLRLVIWGGAPGYGEAFDRMATTLMLNTLESNAPDWLGRWVISADAGHPLCGWPPDHGQRFSREMKRGSLLNAFVGHASSTYCLSMRHQGDEVRYAARHAAATLSEGEPSSPLLLFACDTGNFAGSQECLAESMLAMRGGSGSRHRGDGPLASTYQLLQHGRNTRPVS